MLVKFKNFLFEKAGVPDILVDYDKLILDKLILELDKYINRKGKFANLNIPIIITWDDIKNNVDLSKFKDYPVEEIKIMFRINVKNSKDVANLDFSAYQSIIKKSKSKTKGYYRKSITGLTKTGVVLSMEIELIIKKYANSIDIDNAKEYLNLMVKHEMLHSYEDIHNPSYSIKLEYQMLNSLITNKFNEFDVKSIRLKSFFWILYAIEKTEMNANVAEIVGVNTTLTKTDSWERAKRFLEFNAEEYNKEILDDLKKQEVFDILTKQFGEFFVNHYKICCKVIKIKSDNKILELKDKDLLTVLKFFEKRINKAGEYLKKKLVKTYYIHNITDEDSY